MKKIIITEFLKFQNIDKPKDLVYENAYRVGYWNVFIHSESLESFLTNSNIKFSID